MSRYVHVPAPDYDMTIRHKNPFIPTPDYTTFKYNKAKNRPSLNNIGTEYSQSVELHNQNQDHVFIKPSPRKEVVINKKRSNEYLKPGRFQPRIPDINENVVEIKTHSYIEDREVEEPNHRSTKEHIKQIGVPVLPGIVKPNISSFELAAPVASDQNKAYLRHLENHKKFDTISGDRGIESCEICEIMRKQLEVEQNKQSNQLSWNAQQSGNENHAHAHSSDFPLKRRRTDVRDLFQRNEIQPEPEPSVKSMRARARQNYERKRNDELSVTVMEPVEILQIEQGFVLCRKSNQTVGWIPSHVFEA